MEKVVLINGENQTKLSVFNRLTQFGDGLFETCVVENGKIAFWSAHFARLEKGRKQLKIKSVDEKQWVADIDVALNIAQLKRVVVKIILSRGESERGYGFAADIEPTRIVIISPMPTNLPEKYSLSVCQSGYVNNALLSSIKHCNRLEQILARVDMTGDEGIMLDSNGAVISVTQGNIFAIKSDTVFTPNLDNCGIEGTRRSAILKIVNKLGLKFEIGMLTLQNLYASDEIFITNSVIGVRPVDAINEKKYSHHAITQKITKALKL